MSIAHRTSSPVIFRVYGLLAHTSCRRSLHSSSLPRRQLVGPPDAVSHLRPVIYDDKPEFYPIQHPYSLHEFRDPKTRTDEHEDDFGNYELKLRTAQLDAFNHQFWTETNTRFESAKASVLDALPASATPHDHEEALSHFYRQWAANESSRQEAYSTELRARTRANIFLAARVWYRTWRARLGIA